MHLFLTSILKLFFLDQKQLFSALIQWSFFIPTSFAFRSYSCPPLHSVWSRCVFYGLQGASCCRSCSPRKTYSRPATGVSLGSGLIKNSNVSYFSTLDRSI
ncbi:MAG: hypothetical protein K2Y30_10890 [Flavobacteriaceae bacterium]|nr:hypothetical protein [Flavobacteriaceae bacterium]